LRIGSTRPGDRAGAASYRSPVRGDRLPKMAGGGRPDPLPCNPRLSASPTTTSHDREVI